MSASQDHTETVSSRMPGTGWVPNDWNRVFALLDRALELDDPARSDWLTALDASDPADAAALRVLLARRSALETSDFLVAGARMQGDPPPSALPIAATVPDERLVGPYRLLHEIGRGGTATVWLAERADGLVDRRVALKRPEVQWHGPGFAERIRRERNILASLDHPNIARLYDAGLEPDGRPYLALEYIDGQPIDRYADGRNLSLRARVTLVRDVARAVGHAHAQLVVHRDLKPSNLLVDAGGTVHLVDFGIAKLIDPAPEPAVDGTQLTLAIGRALTPDYASPEQIRGDPIGTASDIYSLGVVAFELFTGERPYRLGAVQGATSMAAVLSGIDVPRASTVTRDADRARALRGDLDAILQRMLGPLPADRYPTMNAVADDLDRHLDGLPVSARAASRAYIVQRWVRRHRIECGIGAALVLALVGGAYAQVLVALAIGAGALLALWQRDSALKQAALARTALERGEQVKSFVASIFTQAVPRTGRGGAVVATDLLKAAARRVETDLAGQPEVAAELGVLIGSSFNELGDMRAAVEWLPKAVALCNRQFGPTHPLTLQARRRWVEAANTIGDLSLAQVQLPSLLMDLRAARPPQTQLLVQALQSKAFVDTKNGRREDALAALHEAIDVGVAREGDGSPIVISARVSLSNTLMHVDGPATALAAIEPAMGPAYALYEAERPHLLLTAVERCYGDALSHGGRPRDATLVLRQVVADQRALDVDETTRIRTATSLLARAYLHRGALDTATALYAEAAAMHDRLTGGANLEGISCWTWLATAHAMVGDGTAAVEALERSESLLDVPQSADVVYLGQPIVVRALVESAVGRPDDALATLAKLAPWADRIAGHWRVRASRVRVAALRALGLGDEALRTATTALAALPDDCVALEEGLLLVELARCARDAGDGALAARSVRRALRRWDADQVDGDALRAATLAEFAPLDASAPD